MHRKNFLRLSTTAAAAIPALGFPVSAFTRSAPVDKPAIADFTGDGLNLSPEAYVQILSQLTANDKLKADNYSLTGNVEELEKKIATILGKESAVFMPTGTLANQLAIRALTGNNKRVIVPEESHVFNDTGDACQVLSDLNLIPLGAGKAVFTMEEVIKVVKKTDSGRVAAKVGAILIESPVRRKSGEVFDYEEMKKIARYAREQDIKMHLDGARLFLATAYTGVSVREYASLFDTLYVSLYKYFNAASGAILAGPKEIISPMYHTRRMFGSGLHQSWPYTAIASYYVDGFSERYAKAVSISEDFIKRLTHNNRFEIHRVPSGTNIFRIVVKGITNESFVENLKSNGIIARADNILPDGLMLQVNESLLHTNAAELEKIFIKSLNG